MNTKFEDLTQRIRALPERHRRTGQVGKLTRYVQEARKAGEDLRASVAVKRELLDAFPGANLTSVGAAAGNAERLALRLKGLVAGNPDAVDSPQADEMVVKLKGQAQTARTGVRDEWRAQLQQVVGRYEKLIAAASKSRIDGAQPLGRALTRIQGYESAEPTSAQVVALRRDLDVLTSAVRELRLEGKGGRFLTQVLDGRGDPAELADAEVRKFLDTHKLWSEIVVVFR